MKIERESRQSDEVVGLGCDVMSLLFAAWWRSRLPMCPINLVWLSEGVVVPSTTFQRPSHDRNAAKRSGIFGDTVGVGQPSMAYGCLTIVLSRRCEKHVSMYRGTFGLSAKVQGPL